MNLPTRHDVLRPLQALARSAASGVRGVPQAPSNAGWRAAVAPLAVVAAAVVAVFVLSMVVVGAQTEGSDRASQDVASQDVDSPRAAQDDARGSKAGDGAKPREMFVPPPHFANADLDRPRCAQATAAVKRLTQGTTAAQVGPEVAQVVDEQVQVVASTCGPVRAAEMNAKYLNSFYG